MSAAPCLSALLAALLAAGCDADRPASTAQRPAPAATSAAPDRAAASPAPPPDTDRSYAYPAAERVVAIGDVHGDLAATRAALRIAGAIDGSDRWIGGKLVLVQTGDEIDRGDGEQAIVDLFDRLAVEARAAGGAVYALNGNHEVMNVQLDFRYVTEGGFKDFEDVPGLDASSPRLAPVPAPARARAAAFFPGGVYAKKLAARDVIITVGDTVFAHGGVLPSHTRYGVARINREVRAWMEGKSPSAPAVIAAEDGPVWARLYSTDPAPTPGSSPCAALDQTLAAMSAKRMVVGHTVQRNGITSACGDKVWRIDVGMAAHYGGKPAALEIAGDTVRILTGEATGANSASGEKK
ncbi:MULTISPECIES: metallophosphoesterase [Sorangium]|uniref:Metallophosphoesterase n=1 Tax=Sorangium cellulosum TaxID=56 RepID=A0A4P2QIY8_SORCE|nr:MULTISPECIES: metallophosphoesterase [Sorangium]AUX29353.1 metallophosphoesterase [Sorangium cellulosum]WCQ88746.1 NinI-like serine-threonine phosphatase [Sorangium sp. Soce836]